MSCVPSAAALTSGTTLLSRRMLSCGISMEKSFTPGLTNRSKCFILDHLGKDRELGRTKADY